MGEWRGLPPEGFLSVVLRFAIEAGVTPRSVLQRYQKLWDRYFDGSSVAVWKLGPKEARVEFARLQARLRHESREPLHGDYARLPRVVGLTPLAIRALDEPLRVMATA